VSIQEIENKLHEIQKAIDEMIEDAIERAVKRAMGDENAR